MSSASELFDSPGPQEPPPLVRWRVWPLRDSILQASIVLGGLAAAAVATFQVTQQLHLAVFAVATLAVALRGCFLPTLFELGTNGVNLWVLGRHRRIPWKAIRRQVVSSSGVLLLPHAECCPLDALHGLYLPWGNRREDVLAKVRYHLCQPNDS